MTTSEKTNTKQISRSFHIRLQWYLLSVSKELWLSELLAASTLYLNQENIAGAGVAVEHGTSSSEEGRHTKTGLRMLTQHTFPGIFFHMICAGSSFGLQKSWPRKHELLRITKFGGSLGLTFWPIPSPSPHFFNAPAALARRMLGLVLRYWTSPDSEKTVPDPSGTLGGTPRMLKDFLLEIQGALQSRYSQVCFVYTELLMVLLGARL